LLSFPFSLRSLRPFLFSFQRVLVALLFKDQVVLNRTLVRVDFNGWALTLVKNLQCAFTCIVGKKIERPVSVRLGTVIIGAARDLYFCALSHRFAPFDDAAINLSCKCLPR